MGFDPFPLFTTYLKYPILNAGGDLQNVDLVEVSIPLALSSYNASLAAIGPLLRPTQEMVNEICEALEKSEPPRTTRTSRLTITLVPGFPEWPCVPPLSPNGARGVTCAWET